MSPDTNNYYGGLMDEMSVYGRALSAAEIAAIYRCRPSPPTGLVGKFDPAVTPPTAWPRPRLCLASPPMIFGENNQWQLDSYTFTATSNSMPLQITGLQPGMLLDDFEVTQAPLTNLYYLPEQSLDALTGDSAYGNWTLQVWDNSNNTALSPTVAIVQAGSCLHPPVQCRRSPRRCRRNRPTPARSWPAKPCIYQVNVPAWAN